MAEAAGGSLSWDHTASAAGLGMEVGAVAQGIAGAVLAAALGTLVGLVEPVVDNERGLLVENSGSDENPEIENDRGCPKSVLRKACYDPGQNSVHDPSGAYSNDCGLGVPAAYHDHGGNRNHLPVRNDCRRHAFDRQIDFVADCPVSGYEW